MTLSVLLKTHGDFRVLKVTQVLLVGNLVLYSVQQRGGCWLSQLAQLLNPLLLVQQE